MKRYKKYVPGSSGRPAILSTSQGARAGTRTTD